MKSKIIFILIVFNSIVIRAQWNLTGNNNATNTNNILGTVLNTNIPVRFHTNGANRMKLNHSLTNTLNGFSAARDGYLLLGNNNNYSGTSTLIYNDGAYSLLHLNGYGTAPIDVLGYRGWMQTGMTLTGNSDLSYIGLRKMGTGDDVTETVIGWSDDGSNLSLGPDELAFRFMGGGTGANTVSTDFTTPNDMDGVHVARFTPEGRMGLGNTFGLDAPGMSVGYASPQNLLHMSINANNAIFMQVTNQNGTGQTATDGLQIGLPTTSASNLEAQINQRENDRLSLFTNNGERIRITHIGALNNGVGFNPGNLATNLTRIGISHNPANPVTRPLSLLHLGYNTETAIPNENGWRPWMDVGMYVSQESDHIYLGIKDEGEDRKDAVISWGDNQVNMGPLGAGPDNLRMIFTSTPFAGANGTPPATGANGLEGMRLTPTPLQRGIYRHRWRPYL